MMRTDDSPIVEMLLIARRSEQTLNAILHLLKPLMKLEIKIMTKLEQLLADMQGMEPVLASAKAFEDAKDALKTAADQHAADLQTQIDTLTANQNDPVVIQGLQDELAKLKLAAAAVAGPAPVEVPATTETIAVQG